MNEDREVGIEDAIEGLGTGGGAAAGAGWLLGERSRNANMAKLSMAKRFYEHNVDRNPSLEGKRQAAREVWKLTGWFRDADGNWKYELAPVGAKFKSFIEDVPTGGRLYNDVRGRLPDFLEHEELYDSVPALRKMRVQQYDMPPGAFFHPDSGIAMSSNISPDLFPEYLAHEVGHASDRVMGHAMGGSPTLSAMQSVDPGLVGKISPEEWYPRLTGENSSVMIQESIRRALGGEQPYSEFPLDRMKTPPLAQFAYVAPPSEDIISGPSKLIAPDHLRTEVTQIPESAYGTTGRIIRNLLKRAL